MTQEELAEKIGKSATAIRNLEHGTYKRPHRETLEGVLDALEMTVEDIDGDEADTVRSRMPPEVRVVCDILAGWLSAMPEEQRKSEIDALTSRIFH